MINQTFNNRYKISSRLGKGAMGIVYKAIDIQSGREVALKVISGNLDVESEFLGRFKREGETLQQLKHPNIVEFLDAFEYEENYVIVMEYVSGRNLHDLIKKGKLSLKHANHIALGLCDALIHSHKLGIIHRDIKPENILLKEDGTPKLADFGVARLNEATRMTRSGTQVGTPYYMAPEAWEGKHLDAQADIWSLGVVIFEMLTGEVPFGGDTGAAVMNKVLTTNPPNIKSLRKEIPSSVVKIVNRMLTRDKKRRYQTMWEVITDLERNQSKTSLLSTKRKSDSVKQSVSIKIWLWGIVGFIGIVTVIGFILKQIPMMLSTPTSDIATVYPVLNQTQQSDILPTPTLAIPTTLIPTTQENITIDITVTSTFFTSPDLDSTATPTSVSFIPNIDSTLISEKDGMNLVYVPAGEFIMGSDDGYARERPIHTVYLDNYWIDQTEVTNAMYAKCVEDGECTPPAFIRSSKRNSYYGNSQFNDYPVIWVSWNQANVYCEWADRRLPTEAEWEKAARGTNGSTYPWGEAIPNANLLNLNRGTGGDTSEVGSYPAGASVYGVLDMASNVWEFVNDWYDENYYANSPSLNPQGPSSGQDKVLRGGTWYLDDILLRSAMRSGVGDPSNSSYSIVGFRCATSVIPIEASNQP